MGYILACEILWAAYTSRRRIQEFLYAHEFKVMLYWGRANDPSKDFLAFYPLSDVERHNLLLSRITNDNETLLGHIFINCETWFHYVCFNWGNQGRAKFFWPIVRMSHSSRLKQKGTSENMIHLKVITISYWERRR